MAEGKPPASERDKGRSSADRAGRGQRDREGSARANGGYDEVAVGEVIRALLRVVGENSERDGFINTPGRMVRFSKGIFAGPRQDPAGVFEAKLDIRHQKMIIVKDIPFYSTCEHHLPPFHGRAHVAYVPNIDGKVTGLPKIAGLVDGYARRPQMREWIATQVAETLGGRLGARGVFVVIEAEYMCMSICGANKSDSRTVTSTVRGVLRNQATRSEALNPIRG